MLTLHLVATALVFFRVRTVSDATWLLSHIWAGLSSFSSDLARLAIAAGVRSLALGLVGYAILEFAERYRPDLRWHRIETSLPFWVLYSSRHAMAVLLAVGVFLLLVLAGGKQNPFLYQVF